MLSILLKTAGLLLALTTAATAQDYPTRAVRLIIPFAPGGSVDIVARLVAAKLSDRLRQQVIPDNRGGAGGIIAMEQAVKAPADGYTIVLVSLAHAGNPSIYKVNYDPVRSVAFVASLGNGASVLTVHPSVPAHSVKELIALAKSKPGDYAFAHAGVGSFTHTASVLFAMMANINVVQIPFKGGGPAMIDVMGGHSHLLMNSYLASVPHIRSGKLRPLGVTELQRWSELPDVPTLDEAGVKGFDVSSWYALMGPANLPRDKVMAINRAVVQGLEAPDVRAKLIEMGTRPATGTPEQLAAFVDREIKRWAPVVKATGLKID